MFRHEGVVRRLREWEAPFEVFAARTVRPQRRTQCDGPLLLRVPRVWLDRVDEGGGASRRDGHVRGDRDGGVRGDRNGGRGCPSTHDPGPSLLRVPHVWLDRVDEGGGAWCRDGDVRGDWDGGVQVDSDGERACPSTHYPGPLLLRVPRVWLAPADEDGGLRVEWDGGVWPSTYAPAGRRSAFPALASDLLEVVSTV
ncbi:hypothetical protein SCP_1005680 [Sparassis crispa]|uniref:Uncharacterized protein n=1 Tax=Sparassis crispa TaxID=139825 RepID=A0A401GYT4_9APHY|nr:hypothetical protein SCP_1005680 [Sparassis crispa]GBE87320.1 hypothetical protein SCP_1005680 [Sparassis crispa]